MGEIGQRVAPEAIDAAPQGPAVAHSVMQIDVGGGPTRRPAARPRRQAVFEPPGRQQLLGDAEGLVELADFTERPVGHEVHRVFAVPYGNPHAESTGSIRRIERDQRTTAVGFDRPPAARLERPLVALAADEGRADERCIRDGKAAQRAWRRPRGHAVAQPQLLEPAVVAPHARPRAGDLHHAVRRSAHARGDELERATERVRPQGPRVAAARERVARGREQRVVEHQAVPLRALRREQQIRMRRLARPEQRRPGGFATQPARHRQVARIGEGRRELREIHDERRSQQVAQALGAHVQLPVAEGPVLGL